VTTVISEIRDKLCISAFWSRHFSWCYLWRYLVCEWHFLSVSEMSKHRIVEDMSIMAHRTKNVTD